MDWIYIVTVAFGILSFFFGAKLRQVFKALDELGDVCEVSARAYDDGKITNEESAAVWKEIQEAIVAIKGIFKIVKK